jgi:hypothetical protein
LKSGKTRSVPGSGWYCFTNGLVSRKKVANSPLSPFLDDKVGHGTGDAGELPLNRL